MTLPPTPTISRQGPPDTSPIARLIADIKEGLVYILQDPLLMRAIFYLTLAATTFLMVATLGPDFITGVIGLPKEDIGYIVGPAGLGVFAGVLLVGKVLRRFERGAVIDWALVGAGIMLFFLALTNAILDVLWIGGDAPQALVVVITGLFAATLGVCNAFILVPAQTLLQERSHEQIRARVYATFFTISNTVSFIPIFFAAASADLFGVVQVLVAVSLIVSALGWGSVWHRRSAEAARWAAQRTSHRQGPETLTAEEE